MKEKLIIMSIILCLAILVSACGKNTDSPMSSESSETPAETFSQSSSSQSQAEASKKPEDNSKESSQSPSSGGDVTPIPAPPPKPVPEVSAPINDPIVEVKRENLQGSTSLSITDTAQEDQILAYVDGLAATDATNPPATGGSVYNVNVSRNGVIEQYTFTAQKTEDGYILAKKLTDPSKWWLADGASYDYLAGLF